MCLREWEEDEFMEKVEIFYFKYFERKFLGFLNGSLIYDFWNFDWMMFN